MDIVKCPYNSYFGELGTLELTKTVCINDECTYGVISGLEFIRHTTLAAAGINVIFMCGCRNKEPLVPQEADGHGGFQHRHAFIKPIIWDGRQDACSQMISYCSISYFSCVPSSVSSGRSARATLMSSASCASVRRSQA